MQTLCHIECTAVSTLDKCAIADETVVPVQSRRDKAAFDIIVGRILHRQSQMTHLALDVPVTLTLERATNGVRFAALKTPNSASQAPYSAGGALQSHFVELFFAIGSQLVFALEASMNVAPTLAFPIGGSGHLMRAISTIAIIAVFATIVAKDTLGVAIHVHVGLAFRFTDSATVFALGAVFAKVVHPVGSLNLPQPLEPFDGLGAPVAVHHLQRLFFFWKNESLHWKKKLIAPTFFFFAGKKKINF